jgi:hypothetical protein
VNKPRRDPNWGREQACDCCGSVRGVQARALRIEPFEGRQLTAWYPLCAVCWRVVPALLPELEARVRSLVLAQLVQGGAA